MYKRETFTRSSFIGRGETQDEENICDERNARASLK